MSINHTPVLTLWGAVVAEQLGYKWEEAITFGKAISGMLARVSLIYPHQGSAFMGYFSDVGIIPLLGPCTLPGGFTKQWYVLFLRWGLQVPEQCQAVLGLV